MSKVKEWKKGDPVESAGWRVLVIASICRDEDCRCVHELEQLIGDELGAARIDVCWDCVTNPGEYIPGASGVKETPIVGIWREGQLLETAWGRAGWDVFKKYFGVELMMSMA